VRATGAHIGAAGRLQVQEKKPNVLFIMGDYIGLMQPSCYHRGLMVGSSDKGVSGE
jgi:arylsulfatase